MAQSSAKTRILVAGASGMLGQKILSALAKKPQVSAIALIRKRDGLPAATASAFTALEKEGVNFVIGDVSDKQSLVKASQGVDVVVSSLSGGEDVVVNGQLNLLEAAKSSRVRRFIPSDFSLNYFTLRLGQHAFLDFRLRVAKEVQNSGLEYTHILNGCFTDVLFSPFLGLYDAKGQSLTYWGDGEQKFDITTQEDTARYTAEAAVDPKAVGVFAVAGDTVSVKDVARIYGEVKGIQLKLINKGPTQDLANWIEAEKAKSPYNPMPYIAKQYLLPMLDGRGKLHDTVNAKYPHIKPTSLKQWLQVNNI